MRMTIMAKIMIIIAFTIVVVEILTSTLSVTVKSENESKSHWQRLSETLQHYAIIFSDKGLPDNYLLTHLTQEESLLQQILLLDADSGETLAHSDHWHESSELKAVMKAGKKQSSFLVETREFQFLRTDFVHKDKKYNLLAVSKSSADRRTTHNFDRGLMILKIFLMGLLFGSIALSIRFMINRPVQKLSKAMKELAEGTISSQSRVILKSNDEMSDLAFYINRIMGRIEKLLFDETTLNEMGQKLATVDDHMIALNIVLSILCEKIGADRGSVYLVNDEQKLELNAFYPVFADKLTVDPRQFALGEGAAGVAAKEKRIIHIENSSREKNYLQHDGEAAKSLICIPLIDGQNAFGVMNFSCDPNAKALNFPGEDFARTAAHLTTTALKIIQLTEIIQENDLVVPSKGLFQEKSFELK